MLLLLYYKTYMFLWCVELRPVVHSFKVVTITLYYRVNKLYMRDRYLLSLCPKANSYLSQNYAFEALVSHSILLCNQSINYKFIIFLCNVLVRSECLPVQLRYN